MAKKAKTKAKPRMVAAKPKESVAAKVIRWHHALAQITGGLARATGAQSLSRHDLDEWAATATQVATEMFALRKEKSK